MRGRADLSPLRRRGRGSSGQAGNPETLLDLLALAAEHADRVAFVYRTGIRRLAFRYGESLRATAAVAARLQDAGLRPGERVLLWGPNSPVWVWSFFGILAAGGIVVPADMRATVPTVRSIAQRARVSLILKTRGKPELDLPCPTLLLEDLFLGWMAERAQEGSAGQDQLIQPRPDDVAELLFTSGTTGDPKGVILTHRNIVSNMAAPEQVIRVDPAWTFVSVLPLSHIFEQVVGCLIPWKVGARVTYLRTLKPSDPDGPRGVLARARRTPGPGLRAHGNLADPHLQFPG